MPPLREFQRIIEDVTNALEADLSAMRLVTADLPELPARSEYLQLGSFSERQLAQLQLNIMAEDRATAVDVLRTFTPVDLCFSPNVLPCYRPAPIVSLTERLYQNFHNIFPAIFYTQYTEGSSRPFTSQLLWYHECQGIRIALITHLKFDPAQLTPTEQLNMPDGILVADKEVNEGVRTATVHWPLVDNMETWYSNFVNTPEEHSDEWPHLLEIKGEQ